MTPAVLGEPRAAGFADRLAAHGDRPALLAADGTITYAQLDDRVRAVAEVLGADRRLILIEATNAVEPLVAYLAALRNGHPVLLAAADDRATGRLVDAYDPDVVVAAADGWSIAERRRRTTHELHPDLALLLSTSGSTGSSKLVRLSRRNLQHNAESIAQYLEITPDHRAITTLPLHYCYGLSVVHSHLSSGAAVVLTDWSVVDRCFWDLFAASGATSLAGVPHTFHLLDSMGFESMSLPSLRHVTQAGGRLAPDMVRKYAALGERDGWRLYVMYGQTEATARMAYLPPEQASSHPGTIGVAIPGGSFTVDDPDDHGVGELVYRGPNVMLGYAEQPDDLRLGPTVDALHTGDLARLTPAGLYELRGRRSRFIKPFGVRVDLDGVEHLLAERAVTSMCTGDDERLVIAIQAGESAGSSAVRDLVAGRLGLPHSRVDVVELSQLPRLASGKPDYAAVGRHAAERPETAYRVDGATPPDSATAIRGAFAEVLGGDPGDGDSFVSLGGDSLSYVEMSLRLEGLLGALPADWHTTPIDRLTPTRQRRGRLRLRHVETSVVLRAVGIVLIVGTHTELWHQPGGAHILLGVAGYNFARFHLGASVTGKLASISRIVLPSLCWIGLLAAISDEFSWPNAMLLNSVLGVPDSPRDYWFIQTIVVILAVAGLLTALRPFRRLERRWPFASAVAVVLAGLAVRFDLFRLEQSEFPFSRPHLIFWCFALGWAAARANSNGRRLIVSALVLVALPGFFGQPEREMIVASGLLAVTWLPTVVVPPPVNRLVGAVAEASLAIYLTHWQVYPPLLRTSGPPLAFAASVVVGVTSWLVLRRAVAFGGPCLARLPWRSGRGADAQASAACGALN